MQGYTQCAMMLALNTSNSRTEHECVQCAMIMALNTSNSRIEHECVEFAAMLVLNTSNRERSERAWVRPMCCDVDNEHK
jgi:hypothetical protein